MTATDLVAVTTHTVMHNLVFGCVLVFLIQWIFLGDLRSAIIVGVNIPFALFFAICMLVLRGEDANLLSIGAVDFGIIIDSAVILVENVFRNFQLPRAERRQILEDMAEGVFGDDPSSGPAAIGWTERLRLILFSCLQIDRAIFFSTAITVAAFVPLFTMQGVEGQIFSPMARTYGYALAGALMATFTVTPVLTSYLLPKNVSEHETIDRAAAERHLQPGAALVARSPPAGRRVRSARPGRHRLPRAQSRQRVPAGPGRGQHVDPCLDAVHHLARSGDAVRRARCARS